MDDHKAVISEDNKNVAKSGIKYMLFFTRVVFIWSRVVSEHHLHYVGGTNISPRYQQHSMKGVSEVIK